jgi:hypothetical protein
MAYQAVNRGVAGNSEGDKTWQTAVVRSLTDELSPPPPAPTADQPAPDQLDATSIIQRVSGLTIGELDKTIHELQEVRGFLVSEEDRMRREMADYLKLTQAAISSTKAMAETIAHFGSVVGDAGKRQNS